MSLRSHLKLPPWLAAMLGFVVLAVVVVGLAAAVASRSLQQVADEKLEWEELMVHRPELSVGLSEAEVREIMGTRGSRYGGPFDRSSKATSVITYHLERHALREAYIRIVFDRGGVSRIETVPGYALPFVSSDWIRFDYDYRGFMAADLVERELLIGRTREEVVSLLGKPRYSKPRHTAWRYDLGDAASAPHPEGLLLVLFEDQDSGRVIEASTHVD